VTTRLLFSAAIPDAHGDYLLRWIRIRYSGRFFVVSVRVVSTPPTHTPVFHTQQNHSLTSTVCEFSKVNELGPQQSYSSNEDIDTDKCVATTQVWVLKGGMRMSERR